MAEYNITANDLERMARMAYLESGSIPVADRVRDYQQVLGSMLTRGQLFANGMAGQGYGGLRSDQGSNTGYENTPIQRSLAAGNAYEPLMKFGNDLSKLPDIPPIYRELAAQYYAEALRNPDSVNLHTDYGNPVIVKDRQGANWQNHWLYGVSQNPNMINGAGSANQHAHGTMTGITLPSSFNPGFDGGAQDWINKYKSVDGLTTPDAIARMQEWANTPDFPFPHAGADGFGDGISLRGETLGHIGDIGTPYETGDAYGFSGTNVSGGVGNGANTLGGATPFGDVSQYAFGSGTNVGGGPNGSFGGLAGLLETGGSQGFSGTNVSGDVAGGMFGPTPRGFDGAGYLAANQDVAAAGMNPWEHFTKYGQAEGRALNLSGDRFSGTSYLAANPDVAAAGMNPLEHYMKYGAAEGRTIGAPGLTGTIGFGTSTPTLGSVPTTGTIGAGAATGAIGAGSAIGALPANFDSVAYLLANPDVAASGMDAGQHYRLYGAQEGRSIGAPGLTATQGAPGLTPTFSAVTDTPTIGAGPTTPTIGAGPATIAFDGGEYLKANADVAASGMSPLEHYLNYGMKEGRAINTLGQHFNGDAYLAANRDVAMAGLDPLAHFMKFGAQEARTLAPTDWASPLTATTEVTPQGASWLASLVGPGPATNTIGAPAFTQTIGPGGLSPTIGAGPTVPTIGAGPTQQAWSPGGGISNPYGFSGANVGGGLGATAQSFGSFYGPTPGGGDAGSASGGGSNVSDPFSFTQANVGGFDVNAGGGGAQGGGGPNSVNEMGISGGFDAEGAMRRVLEQQAADIRRADQAAKTPMHSDPNAFNVAIANGGNTVGMGTALQTPGAIGVPVVPNLTTANMARGAPGAMFSMFAPW